MIWQRTQNRRWNGKEIEPNKGMWFWALVGVLLAVTIGLMIASDNQPSNASPDIWSAETMVGQQDKTLMWERVGSRSQAGPAPNPHGTCGCAAYPIHTIVAVAHADRHPTDQGHSFI